MEPAELFSEWLENTTHAGKQVDAHGVHLTVAEVLTVHSKGKVDFGGSEFKPASTHPVEFFERSPGDRFSWWRLDGGSGDQYVKIVVEVPVKLTPEEKKILTRLAEIESNNIGPIKSDFMKKVKKVLDKGEQNPKP